MEEETEDLRRIDEIINRHKTEVQDDEEEPYEYGDFINYEELSEPEEIDDDYVLTDFQTTDISKFQSYSPSDLLKDEEKQIVDSCSDPELKTLLQLNRTKNIQLMQLYKKIKDLLFECQKNIVARNQVIEAMKIHKRTFFRVWRLGYPYFKTKDNFPCPRNDDAIEKDKNKELLFYQMTPSKKWNQLEMNRLMKGVIFCYKMGREFELKKRIAKLETEMKKQGSKDRQEDLKELDSRLRDLMHSNDEEPPPLGSEKYIDWNKVSTSFLRCKYTDLECKIMWYLYLDPHVNKSAWQREEEGKLVELADIYKYQDWDQITNDLGTQRSSLLACTHYFCNVIKPKKKRFTPEEDEFLYKIVQSYKQGSFIPWSKIARHFVDKDRHQIFYRYRYCLSLKSKVSGSVRKFSEAEDVLLMILVNKFGRKYSRCEEYFPDRSMMQLKARYTSNLRNPIKKGAFSVEEDEKILDHVREHGESNWVPLQKTMTRYSAQIRQRYRTLATFIQQNPDKPVSFAPRRTLDNMKGTGKDNKYEFLRTIAERYQDQIEIPTLEDIEKVIKESSEGEVLKSESPFCSTQSTSAIDSLLTEFFVETCRQEEEECPDEDYKRFTRMIQHLLNIFESTLMIPSDISVHDLDEFDLNVLEKLKNKALYVDNHHILPHKPTTDLGEIVPPNLETLAALHSLLINTDQKFTSFKEISISHIFDTLKSLLNEDETKKIEWCVNKYISSLEEDVQYELNEERNTFFQRFIALFKYPAIVMLNNEPSEELLEACASYTKVPVRKTYSRNKTTESTVTSDRNPPEQAPVNSIVKTETETPEDPLRHVVWMKSETHDEDPQPRTYLKKDRNSKINDIDPLFNKEQQQQDDTSIRNEEQNDFVDTLTKENVTSMSMVERLKLRIKNELMDLDKKGKSKMSFNEWKNPEPFCNPTSVQWREKNWQTYMNRKKATPARGNNNAKESYSIDDHGEKQSSIDVPPDDESKHKIELDFREPYAYETFNPLVVPDVKTYKKMITEDQTRRKPKIIRLTLPDVTVEDTKKKESDDEDTKTKESDRKIEELFLQNHPEVSINKQCVKQKVEVKRLGKNKPPKNLGFLVENLESLDNMNLLDRMNLGKNETKQSKKRTQSSQEDEDIHGTPKRLKIFLSAPKVEKDMNIEMGHGRFNFQKGELVEDSDSDSDLKDLEALKNVLNKVKMEVVEDDV